MYFRTVSEKEFKDTDCARQIISHKNPRKFALLQIDENHGEYGLSWCGDLIDPITFVNEITSTVWIGVDQRLVAISKLKGNIVVSLTLDSNLIDIVSSEPTIAALSETELFLFNSNGSIQLMKALPEIGSELSVTDDGFCVNMIDGGTLSVDDGFKELVGL
jgi:hypothetical protein